MKNLILVAVVFLSLLLTGCQENSIFDSNPVEASNKFYTEGQGLEIIPLDGFLPVPGQTGQYFKIQGEITYTHGLFFIDPIPSEPQYYIKLDLVINAVLYGSTLNYKITDQSQDNFYVSEEGIQMLEKYFTINGSNGLALVCTFIVTKEGVGLNAMALTFIDKD
jgi:hypothetical protein